MRPALTAMLKRKMLAPFFATRRRGVVEDVVAGRKVSVSAGSLVELRVRGCAADVAKGSSGFLDFVSCHGSPSLQECRVIGIPKPSRRSSVLMEGR